MQEFDEAAARFRTTLEATPDERFFWQPAETARSAGMLAMSVALALADLRGVLKGAPLPYADGEAWNAASREVEVTVTDRREVESRLEAEFAAFRSLSMEGAAMVDAGFGEVSSATVVGWAVANIQNRKSQLDYLQTLYGDLRIY